MHLNRVMALTLFAGLAAVDVPARAADPAWLEVKSPNFTIVSDAGEKAARKAAWQFEQSRAVFLRLWPWATFDAGRPFVVYAAKDERSMRLLAPEFWEVKNGVRPASVSVSAADRHYIAVRADQQIGDRDMNPYINSYWSYAGIVVNSSFEREVPLWFHRGLASVFSNTIVREGDILIGAIIPSHIRQLRQGERLSLQQVMDITRASPYMSQADRMETFDAATWALVHFMMFGHEGRNTARFNVFANAFRGGATVDAAMTEAFGSVEAVARGYAQYVDRFAFVYRRLDVDVSIAPEKFPTRTYTLPEAAAMRAALHVAMRRPTEARALLDEALKATPPPPIAHEIDGLYWDVQDDDEKAREAYGRAVDQGEAGFFAARRFAGLAWPDADAPNRQETLTRIEKALLRAASIDTSSSDVYTQLAQAVSGLGRHEHALSLARRAATLAPSRARPRLVIADILVSLERHQEALTEAKQAASLASADAERNHARQLVEWLERVTAAAQSAKAAPASAAGSATGHAPPAGADPQQLQADCSSGKDAACASLVPIAETACKEGNLSACAALGWLLEAGRGVPADAARAASLYEQACAGGIKGACVGLALSHARRGTKADIARARVLLTDACAASVPQSCDLLKSLPK